MWFCRFTLHSTFYKTFFWHLFFWYCIKRSNKCFNKKDLRCEDRFTYRTRLSVTCFVVHSVSSTLLSTMLRGRVQTLPLATLQTSTTRLWAQRPLGPARPASGNYTQTHHVPVSQLQSSLCVHFLYCILTGAERIVASLCLPGAARAPSAPLLWWRVVAETNACDVACSTCGCTRRPGRPKAPVPISTH